MIPTFPLTSTLKARPRESGRDEVEKGAGNEERYVCLTSCCGMERDDLWQWNHDLRLRELRFLLEPPLERGRLSVMPVEAQASLATLEQKGAA